MQTAYLFREGGPIQSQTLILEQHPQLVEFRSLLIEREGHPEELAGAVRSPISKDH
jgi:hypothetical protein